MRSLQLIVVHEHFCAHNTATLKDPAMKYLLFMKTLFNSQDATVPDGIGTDSWLLPHGSGLISQDSPLIATIGFTKSKVALQFSTQGCHH